MNKIDETMLKSLGINRKILEDYLAKYDKSMQTFEAMSLGTQIAWCEEARKYSLENDDLAKQS